MADITWSDVTDHAPELSTVSANAQTDILAYVNDALDVAAFGGEDAAKTKLARVYMAAHMATVSENAAGGGGEVVSRAQGDMSISYAASSAGSSADGYSATGYGRQYLTLVKSTYLRGGLLL